MGGQGSLYKDLAKGVQWKVNAMMGQAEKWGAVQRGEPMWFRKIGD
jgi:hypothetical protein